MAEYLIQDATLTSIADEIRTMHETEDTIAPGTMIAKLQDANTQIGNQEVMLIDIAEMLQTKAIGASPALQSKTVTPSANTQIVTPDESYDGLASVVVNGDENLVAENIAEGVKIFGVTGTYAGGAGGGGAISTCEVTFINNADDSYDCYGMWTDDGSTFYTYQASVLDGDSTTKTAVKNSYIIVPTSNVSVTNAMADKYAIDGQTVVLINDNSSITITIS